MIESAESASKVNRFAAYEKQRSLALLQRTSNNHARTNPGAEIPIPRHFFIAFPTVAKSLHHIENNADGFPGMICVRNWEAKESDDAFAVSRVEVSTFFREVRGGLANKF